jgi:glycosyltransferase involved in cell wall biosynthesis
MFNLGRDLVRRGHEVRVLTGYLEAEPFDGPPITINDDIGVFDDRETGAAIVSAFIGAVAPDIIISHHLYAYQFKDEIVSSGVPLVQVVLNSERIPEATFAVYISKWVRERVGSEEYDLTITPPAFDDIVAESHGDYIGFIKPISHKGIDLIYDIAGWFPERKFLILRGEWQTLEIINPADNIEFLEPVKDMRDFYSRCRMVLMPSRSEDAGTVAQEAALNGIPCLSSNVEGLAETNAGGILLDRDDELGFVAWIMALDDEKLYEAVVERQKDHMSGTDQDGLLQQFAEGLESVAGGLGIPWYVDGDE